MNGTRTFVDAGILIAAARGDDEAAVRAMAILDDPERVLVTSVFVRLEVLPKAAYHRNQFEVAFYNRFFDSVARLVPASVALIDAAEREGCACGLSALDALHVAAAKRAKCATVMTTERPGKPMFRASGITVETIQSGADK